MDRSSNRSYNNHGGQVAADCATDEGGADGDAARPVAKLVPFCKSQATWRRRTRRFLSY